MQLLLALAALLVELTLPVVLVVRRLLQALEVAVEAVESVVLASADEVVPVDYLREEHKLEAVLVVLGVSRMEAVGVVLVVLVVLLLPPLLAFHSVVVVGAVEAVVVRPPPVLPGFLATLKFRSIRNESSTN